MDYNCVKLRKSIAKSHGYAQKKKRNVKENYLLQITMRKMSHLVRKNST